MADEENPSPCHGSIVAWQAGTICGLKASAHLLYSDILGLEHKAIAMQRVVEAAVELAKVFTLESPEYTALLLAIEEHLAFVRKQKGDDADGRTPEKSEPPVHTTAPADEAGVSEAKRITASDRIRWIDDYVLQLKAVVAAAEHWDEQRGKEARTYRPWETALHNAVLDCYRID